MFCDCTGEQAHKHAENQAHSVTLTECTNRIAIEQQLRVCEQLHHVLSDPGDNAFRVFDLLSKYAPSKPGVLKAALCMFLPEVPAGRVLHAVLATTRLDRVVLDPGQERAATLMAAQRWLDASDVLVGLPKVNVEVPGTETNELLLAICQLCLGFESSILHTEDELVASTSMTGMLQDVFYALSSPDSGACFGHALACVCAARSAPEGLFARWCVPLTHTVLRKHIVVVAPRISSKPDEFSLEQRTAISVEKLRRRAGDSASLKELLSMTGIAPVKEAYFQIKDHVALVKERKQALKDQQYNAMYTGNPGTGKTSVARIYARFLEELGVLPSGGSVEETSGAKLVAGGTAVLKEHLDNLSTGGVLFVDEAYQLSPKKNAMGGQVLDLLLTEMEDRRGALGTIILAITVLPITTH